MTILVGTASWADKSLIDSGKFYPPDVTSPEARFALLRLPVPDGGGRLQLLRHAASGDCAAMGRAHTEHFVFNVKAFRLFTGHQAQPRVLPKDIREALGLPLHQNVYYRDLPEEIQKELWGRFFGTAVPRRMAIFAEDGHPRSRHPKAAA